MHVYVCIYIYRGGKLYVHVYVYIGVANFGGEQTTAPTRAGGDSAQPSIRSFMSQSPSARGGGGSRAGGAGGAGEGEDVDDSYLYMMEEEEGQTTSLDGGGADGRHSDEGVSGRREDCGGISFREDMHEGTSADHGDAEAGCPQQSRSAACSRDAHTRAGGGGDGGIRKRQRVFQEGSDDE